MIVCQSGLPPDKDWLAWQYDSVSEWTTPGQRLVGLAV
jgi:hypothetical protein